jgi:hypothetical protein
MIDIEMDIQAIGSIPVERIYPAQDWYQYPAVVNMVMNHCVFHTIGRIH